MESCETGTHDNLQDQKHYKYLFIYFVSLSIMSPGCSSPVYMLHKNWEPIEDKGAISSNITSLTSGELKSHHVIRYGRPKNVTGPTIENSDKIASRFLAPLSHALFAPPLFTPRGL